MAKYFDTTAEMAYLYVIENTESHTAANGAIVNEGFARSHTVLQ